MNKLPRLLVLLAALALPAQAQTYVQIQNLPVPSTGSTSLQSGDTIVADRNGVTYGLFYTPPASLVAGTNIVITGSTIATTSTPTFADTTVDGLIDGNGFVSNGTTFTIASGCGSGGSAPTSLTGGATTGSFVANATSCAPVINLPLAPNGWWCRAQDITHTTDLFVQTATTDDSCTLSATVSTSDTILIHAEGY